VKERGVLHTLTARWRAEAELFRRRGAAEAAATLEDCAAELEALDGSKPPEHGAPAGETSEPMLAAKQVAALLGTSERWVYDHADQLGGKRLSRRTLRFGQAAVRRWLERRS